MKTRGTCLTRAWVALAGTMFLAAAAPAFAQQSAEIGPLHLDLQNVVESDWGLSTAGVGNEFNNNNNIPGSGQAYSTNGNTLSQAVFREDALLNGRLGSDTANMIGMDNIEAYIHSRFYSDIVGQVDHYVPEPNILNMRQSYPGNGWSAYTGGHEYEWDAAEAYTDWRKGPLWIRLGKQQIVYGEELGLQTLDQVQSMDFRRGGGFNYAGQEFSDIRIATWAGRGTYDFGDVLAPLYLTGTRLTSWISEFQPSQFPGVGSPYNIGFTAILDPVNSTVNGTNGIARARHKLVYGAVLESNFMGVDWSANFYSTPEHVGGGFFDVAAPNGFLALVNNYRGSPLAPGGPNVVVPITRNFPRIFIYGGMASYMIQPVYEFPGATIINGDMVRVSGTYTPNKSFGTDRMFTTGHSKRMGEVNVSLDIEKNFRWTDKLPSAYIFTEYNFRSRSGVFDGFIPGTLGVTCTAGCGHRKSFNLWVLSVSQPLPMSRWSFAWVHSMELSDGTSWFFQPAVVYKPTSAQEYRLFWNFAEGTRRSTFGPSRSADALMGEVLYKF